MNIAKGKPRVFTGHVIRISAMLLVVCATSNRVQAQSSKSDTKGKQSKSALSAELQAVLKNHPDILAAQARVRLAEAELNQVKLRIAQEVVILQKQLESLEQTTAILRTQHDVGLGNPAEMAEFIEAQAKLATLKAKRVLMLGSRKVTVPAHFLTVKLRGPAKEAPMAAMAEKIRSALLVEANFIINDQPLEDALTFIGDQHKIPIHIDRAAFEEEGDDLDTQNITFTVSDVPFGAAIEALEDRYPIRFLVRNYGILVTTKGSNSDEKYMSALELWKQKAPAAKDKTKPKPSKKGDEKPKRR